MLLPVNISKKLFKDKTALLKKQKNKKFLYLRDRDLFKKTNMLIYEDILGDLSTKFEKNWRQKMS